MKNAPKMWALGLLLAVFVAGAALGSTVSAAWGDSDRRDRRSSGGYSDMLARELGLTDSQKNSVASILESSRPEMCAIWEEYRPQFDSLRAQIRQRIGSVLTAEQKVTHEALLTRRDSLRAVRKAASDSSGRRNGCQ